MIDVFVVVHNIMCCYDFGSTVKEEEIAVYHSRRKI